MISGFTAPGELGLGGRCGGRLVYITLSTSAMSPSFRFHIRSSTCFRTSSQRPSAVGAGVVGVVAARGAGVAAGGGGPSRQGRGGRMHDNRMNGFNGGFILH